MPKRRNNTLGRKQASKRRRISNNGGLSRVPRNLITLASPFNRLMLTSYVKATASGTSTVSTSTIRTSLRAELGLSTSLSIDLRILNMKVRVPASVATGTVNNIIFAPCDWTTMPSTTSPFHIQWYEVWGTVTNLASINYTWPRHLRNIVIPNANDTPLATFDNITHNEYVVTTTLRWRPSTPDPRPTSDATLLPYRGLRTQTELTNSPSAFGFEDVSLTSN